MNIWRDRKKHPEDIPLSTFDLFAPPKPPQSPEAMMRAFMAATGSVLRPLDPEDQNLIRVDDQPAPAGRRRRTSAPKGDPA